MLIAADRESEIVRWDTKKVVVETLEDIGKGLRIAGVSKGLKPDLARDLKEAAGRTRSAILHLAAEAQKGIRRSSERENLQKNKQISDLKEELNKTRIIMLAMKDEMESMRRKIEEYERRREELTTNRRKKDATNSLIKGDSRANEAYVLTGSHRDDEHYMKKLDSIFEKWLITRNFNIGDSETRTHSHNENGKTTRT